MKKDRQILKRDKFKYLFYPSTSLILTSITGIIVVVIMFIVLSTFEKGAVGYDISFALLTGVIASIPIAIALEMANNLKANKLAWYELYDYHKTLLDYDYICKDIDDDKTVSFLYLYMLAPIFLNTLENKKEFLTYKEIDYLEEFKHEYTCVKKLIINYLRNNMIKESVSDSELNNTINDSLYEEKLNNIANSLLNNKDSLISLNELIYDEQLDIHTLVISTDIKELTGEASKKPVFDIMIKRLNDNSL